MYKITIKALGYETLEQIIQADSLKEAKRAQAQAMADWLALNDIGKDSAGLAFVHVGKV
jgi:hypothetical protein